MLKTRQSGFTVVELLIVIVVIAILAAISVVAYTGIQDRARISSIQTDLRSVSQKLNMYSIDNSESYPITSGQVSNSGIGGVISTAYENDALYCGSSERFAVFIRTTSGVTSRQFQIGSDTAVREVLPTLGWSPDSLCPTTTYSYRSWSNFW